MEDQERVDKSVEEIVKRKLIKFVTDVVTHKDKSFTLKISGRQGRITGFGTEVNESSR